MHATQHLTPGQLTYLKDVLGLDSVVLPTVSMHIEDVASYAAPAPKNLVKLRVLVRPQIFNGDARDDRALIEKMIQAMKLEADQVEWLSARPDVTQGPPILAFGECDGLIEMTPEGLRPLGEWFQASGLRTFITYDPHRLRQNPELKKAAWEHLKTVMRDF